MPIVTSAYQTLSQPGKLRLRKKDRKVRSVACTIIYDRKVCFSLQLTSRSGAPKEERDRHDNLKCKQATALKFIFLITVKNSHFFI